MEIEHAQLGDGRGEVVTLDAVEHGDEVELVVPFDDLRDALAHQRMVLDDDDRGHRAGTQSRTRVPSLGVERTSVPPPASCIRIVIDCVVPKPAGSMPGRSRRPRRARDHFDLPGCAAYAQHGAVDSGVLGHVRERFTSRVPTSAAVTTGVDIEGALGRDEIDPQLEVLLGLADQLRQRGDEVVRSRARSQIGPQAPALFARPARGLPRGRRAMPDAKASRVWSTERAASDVGGCAPVRWRAPVPLLLSHRNPLFVRRQPRRQTVRTRPPTPTRSSETRRSSVRSTLQWSRPPRRANESRVE